MTTEDAAGRLHLAARIMTLVYHQNHVAWLEVVPVTAVVDDANRIPVVTDAPLSPAEDTPLRRRAQIFLEDNSGAHGDACT